MGEGGERGAVDVPHLGGAVRTGGDDTGPVGAEHRRHHVVVVGEGDERGTVDAPNPGGAVPTGGDDTRPVGAERRRLHVVVVGEGGERGAVDVPHQGGVVPTGGDDPGPVGAEHRRHHAVVVGKGGDGVPSTSQTRAVSSQLAVTIRVPSGLNTADGTSSSWGRVASGVPSTSHTWARAVRAGGDDPRPVGGEHRRYHVVVVGKGGERGAVDVPNLGGVSRLAVTMRVPSGLNTADRTLSSWGRVASGVPSTSQNLGGAVPTGGDDPGPVRAEHRRYHLPSWGRVTSGPVGSQTWAVLSRLAVTMRVPSGLNTADRTSSSWVRVASGVPSTSHICAVLSKLAVTMRVPSGLNTAEPPRRRGEGCRAGCRRRVPNLGGVVPTGGDDTGPVGAEQRRLHAVVVGKGGERGAVDVPNPGGTHRTGGDDTGPVGVEHRRPHAVVVGKGDERGAVDVPHLGGAIPTGGDDAGPVGLNTADSKPLVVGKGGEGGAVDVPYLGGAIPTGGDDTGPVGAEHCRQQVVVVGKGDEGVPSTSQTWAVSSRLAVTIRVPSGLNTADTTSSSWGRVASGVPSTSQTWAASSQLAVTIRVPSGLNTADSTRSACVRVARQGEAATSYKAA